MNTEIFDYLKSISKKEYFVVNLLSSLLSIVIIITALISLLQGAEARLYSIMFGCATLVLWLNAYKFKKRKSKNAWFLIITGIFTCLLTGMFIYMIFAG